MVADLLSTGKENARTGRTLAKLLRCNIRDITAWIERERRAGLPICASNDPEHPGYYLAGTAGELQRYCNMLDKRADELRKTSLALLKKAQALSEMELEKA